MISTKKRTAETDGDKQIKKPKFEKKSFQKGKIGLKNGFKPNNPFQKSGT